jgi:hypothetical protein
MSFHHSKDADQILAVEAVTGEVRLGNANELILPSGDNSIQSFARIDTTEDGADRQRPPVAADLIGRVKIGRPVADENLSSVRHDLMPPVA